MQEMCRLQSTSCIAHTQATQPKGPTESQAQAAGRDVEERLRAELAAQRAVTAQLKEEVSTAPQSYAHFTDECYLVIAKHTRFNDDLSVATNPCAHANPSACNGT